MTSPHTLTMTPVIQTAMTDWITKNLPSGTYTFAPDTQNPKNTVITVNLTADQEKTFQAAVQAIVAPHLNAPHE